MENISTLKLMFPGWDEQAIELMLSSNSGNFDATVACLLSMSNDDSDTSKNSYISPTSYHFHKEQQLIPARDITNNGRLYVTHTENAPGPRNKSDTTPKGTAEISPENTNIPKSEFCLYQPSNIDARACPLQDIFPDLDVHMLERILGEKNGDVNEAVSAVILIQENITHGYHVKELNEGCKDSNQPSFMQHHFSENLSSTFEKISFADTCMTGATPDNTIPLNSDINIIVVGRTGDGKSTLCNTIVKVMGHPASPFAESALASSHTHKPVSCNIHGTDIMIMDTPGLMDSHGIERDEHNIKLIVEEVSKCRSISSFVFVVNEQVDRFDDGMQKAIKLFIDSFGAKCLNNLGIIFTKSFGLVDAAQSLQRSKEIARLISNRTGIPLETLPSWQVDCHPEALASLGVLQDRIDELILRTTTSIHDMIRWSRAKPRLDTTGSVLGEYDEQKATRIHQEMMAEIQAQAKTKVEILEQKIEAERIKVEILREEKEAIEKAAYEAMAKIENEWKAVQDEINKGNHDLERIRTKEWKLLEEEQSRLQQQRERETQEFKVQLQRLEHQLNSRLMQQMCLEIEQEDWSRVIPEPTCLSSSVENWSGIPEALASGFGALMNPGAMAKSVCKIFLPGGSGTGFCVSLEGRYCIITNNHVLCDRETAAASSCLFNFLAEEMANRPRVNMRPDLLFWTDPRGRLDCTIVAIEPKAKGFQPLQYARDSSSEGTDIQVWGHPSGEVLQMSSGSIVKRDEAKKHVYYKSGTLPGSSGSPVIDATTGKVIAIHHSGNKAEGNIGSCIPAILRKFKTDGSGKPQPSLCTGHSRNPTYNERPSHASDLGIRNDDWSSSAKTRRPLKSFLSNDGGSRSSLPLRTRKSKHRVGKRVALARKLGSEALGSSSNFSVDMGEDFDTSGDDLNAGEDFDSSGDDLDFPTSRDLQAGWTTVSGEYRPVYQGPKGGRYYFTSGGNKKYI